MLGTGGGWQYRLYVVFVTWKIMACIVIWMVLIQIFYLLQR